MKVRWSQVASEDLAEIVRFIRKDSVEASRRVKVTIVSQVAGLGAMPFSGRAGEVDSTRELVLPWSYIAVYGVFQDEVVVLRIRHEAREWPVA